MGYLIARALAEIEGWSFKESKQFCADVAKGKSGELPMHVLLPLTYMNESGRAVRQYLDYAKIPVEALIVICDDVYLPFGSFRLRDRGSAGGHNGLRSIEEQLQTPVYARLRVGIGRELQQQKTLAEYVLDDFSEPEKAQLPAVMDAGVKILKRLMSENLSTVMNNLHTMGPIQMG